MEWSNHFCFQIQTSNNNASTNVNILSYDRRRLSTGAGEGDFNMDVHHIRRWLEYFMKHILLENGNNSAPTTGTIYFACPFYNLNLSASEYTYSICKLRTYMPKPEGV